MRTKTEDLIGAALDWAVAKCEAVDPETLNTKTGVVYTLRYGHYTPSANWAQGGPIIEREVPMLFKTNGGNWVAHSQYDFIKDCEAQRFYGPTPLIAAMRAYVASKLGAEVDVPEELV